MNSHVGGLSQVSIMLKRAKAWGISIDQSRYQARLDLMLPMTSANSWWFNQDRSQLRMASRNTRSSTKATETGVRTIDDTLRPFFASWTTSLIDFGPGSIAVTVEGQLPSRSCEEFVHRRRLSAIGFLHDRCNSIHGTRDTRPTLGRTELLPTIQRIYFVRGPLNC